MPENARRVTRSFCAVRTELVQARSRSVPTTPPAAATRWASDGVLRTTITRRLGATRGREPTSPCQADALIAGAGGWPALLPPVASRTAVAETTTSPSRTACRGSARGVRIEAKISGVRDGVREAPRGGDHRRVVGAERGRCERGPGQRLAQLGVGRDPADDGDPRRAGQLGGLAHAAHEGPDDRPLVRGCEIGTPRVELLP